jgi:hypothetical protein
VNISDSWCRDNSSWCHAKEDCPLLKNEEEIILGVSDLLLVAEEAHLHWNKFDENGQFCDDNKNKAVTAWFFRLIEKINDEEDSRPTSPRE